MTFPWLAGKFTGFVTIHLSPCFSRVTALLVPFVISSLSTSSVPFGSGSAALEDAVPSAWSFLACL